MREWFPLVECRDRDAGPAVHRRPGVVLEPLREVPIQQNLSLNFVLNYPETARACELVPDKVQEVLILKGNVARSS